MKNLSDGSDNTSDSIFYFRYSKILYALQGDANWLKMRKFPSRPLPGSVVRPGTNY